MAKTRVQKEKIIESLSQVIKSAKVILLSSFDKISVGQIVKLRKALRDSDAKYIVIKKKFLPIIFKKADVKSKPERIAGSLALIIGQKDEIGPAKILADFIETSEGVNFLGGILGDRYLNQIEVEFLAKLPSQTELVAKLVYLLVYPIRGLALTLSGQNRNLVYILNNLKIKRESV